jgi:hypothetical protein
MKRILSSSDFKALAIAAMVVACSTLRTNDTRPRFNVIGFFRE